MSSIMRLRSGLTVLVSLMESSILSEVDDTSILRTGLPSPLWPSSQLATGLSPLAPAQLAGAQRLCAMAPSVTPWAHTTFPQLRADRPYDQPGDDSRP